ncbi:MAG: penicillin-binding protein 2 [Ardenticatenaceae bacterium]|nr:penicillin-binding protein 2 [Anaerolineales bacterium]MCB8923219.1 penicillin-binding protein 2 [Ardenticatenaceae bacterium]MCB9004836.1 penicillin-binding protein 2 [Ardenticatenaceae bacterium]
MSRMGWERIEELELQQQDDPGVYGRLFFFRIFIVAIFGLLLYRVYFLQQNSGEELQTLAADNQFAELLTDAPRGVIFDRNGELLAVNQPSFNVTITPAFLPDTEEEQQAVYARLSALTGVPITNTVQQEALVAAANPELVGSYTRLAEIYGVSPRDTLDQAGIVPQLPQSIEGIVQENSFAQYVPAVITSGLPITLAYTIEQESIFLPGVRVLPEPLRYYPAGEYTAHIIGYMGPIPNEGWLDLGYERDDRVGWSGLESSMEIELAGQKGVRRIVQDWTGREVQQIGLEVPPVAGLNMHLTLDLELQKVASEILAQYMEANRNSVRTDEITGEQTYPEIEQAVVVVLNPKTGEVLAMVSYPTFDNNRFQTEVPVDYYLGLARNDYTPLVNHAISGTYPPGSTFKLVPASGAMQVGTISPERLLFDPGQITIANRFAPNDPGRAQTFVCWNREGHGLVNMYTGIANSCDVYFYKITGGFDQDGEYVEGLGVDRLGIYATQFGFGRVQGIELPLEAQGNLPSRAWKNRTQGEPWSTGDDYNLGIGQGFMTATPLQVAQMAAVVANGGFLYRPSIIHHLTDENGNVVIVDENSQVIARAHPGEDGEVVVTDANGLVIPNTFNIRFDENGNYIFQPEVIDSLDVDREYLDVVAEGMRLVNTRVDEEKFYTGATYVNWLEDFGITTAGKTGTAEYCDNIAIKRGWCNDQKQVQPTHAWYVGYAPFDDPEIAVAVFTFNGGEGSAWSAPVACHVMAAYFGVGQYADPATFLDGQPADYACTPTSQFGFRPEWPLPQETLPVESVNGN